MQADNHNTRLGICIRGLVVWIVIIAAEIVHGILRAVALIPIVGGFRSNQIGVFTGSLIILVIAWLSIRWIGASRNSDLMMVGSLWLALTLAFELLFGRLVMNLSWQRLLADYNLLAGGLMPLGLLALLFAPWIASKTRPLPSSINQTRRNHEPSMNVAIRPEQRDDWSK